MNLKINKIVIKFEDGTEREIEVNQKPFVLFYESGDQIECEGDLSPEFVQDMLIINPFMRFADEYENGEIGGCGRRRSRIVIQTTSLLRNVSELELQLVRQREHRGLMRGI